MACTMYLSHVDKGYIHTVSLHPIGIRSKIINVAHSAYSHPPEASLNL